MSEGELQAMPRLLLYAGTGTPISDDPGVLVKAMSELGLVGINLDQSLSDYLPGDRFLEHITFLGCSPNIALSPEEGTQYCYIRFAQMRPSPVLYASTNTVPPRCRQCEQVMHDWRNASDPGFCNRCSVEARQDNLMWRRQGALSRWVIEILNIYPREAVPSVLLLRTLENVSGVEWRYAYLQA